MSMSQPKPVEPEAVGSRKFFYPLKYSFSEDFTLLMERMYETYGDIIFRIHGISDGNLDIAQFSKDFFRTNAKDSSVAEVSTDPNANIVENSVAQYVPEVGKSALRMDAVYMMYKWIKKLYGVEQAETTIEMLINGTIFVNDLHTFHYQPYCYAFDLRNLLIKGMDFYTHNMVIHPPKRSESFIALIIQSTAYIANQIAGAVSWPDFFVVLDYFYRREFGADYAKNIDESGDWPKIKNQFQNFIYSMNFPFRSSGQSPFTNISVMDSGFLNSLFAEYTFPDFSKPDLESTKLLSKRFFEYFSSINSVEGIFTFPVVTIAIALDEKGEYIDPDFAKWAAKVNSEKALANIFQDEPTSFSSCCRLRNSYKEVGSLGFQNSFGVSGLSIGSHRVAGINMAKLSILEKTNPECFENIMRIVRGILVVHRKIVERRVKEGFLPLYTRGWIDLKRQYSTVGFIGAYEYVKNKGEDILTERGQELLKAVLKKMETKILAWQKEEKNIYNIEQIPGESFGPKLAKIDRILGFNNNDELYSNQYVPLIEDTGLFNRIRIQGIFDQFTSGGSILHLNVDDEKPIPENVFFNLMDSCRKNRVTYFAVNYAYSKCEKGTFYIGKKDTCPIHGDKTVETYTRVVGFITPVRSAWNVTRRDFEFPKRVFYRNGALSEDKLKE